MYYYVTDGAGHRIMGFDTHYEAINYASARIQRGYAGLLRVIKGAPFDD